MQLFSISSVLCNVLESLGVDAFQQTVHYRLIIPNWWSATKGISRRRSDIKCNLLPQALTASQVPSTEEPDYLVADPLITSHTKFTHATLTSNPYIHFEINYHRRGQAGASWISQTSNPYDGPPYASHNLVHHTMIPYHAIYKL